MTVNSPAHIEPAAEWRELYPFAPHELRIGSHRYHYIDQGEGEPVLMVHGNPTWSFYWRRLIGALEDRYRMIAPDHLGCGLSDKPGDWPYRLSDHTANLVKLVDELDLKNVTLVAHDWGGPIGLGAALARPEVFQRFVLLNTGAFPPWFIPWRIGVCRWPVVGRLGVQGLNLFARAALRMTTVHPERLTPAVQAGYLAPYDNWAHRIATYRFVKDIPRSPRHPSYEVLHDLAARLPTLADRPFQLIWGMQDWCFTPACLEKLIELLPGAEVHRLEDAGHWVMEDAPEYVIECVERMLRGEVGRVGRSER